MADPVRRFLPLLLLLLGLWQLAGAAWIDAKAVLAQQLIAGAWERSLQAGGAAEKPWPWADTWPVARLQVPRHAVDLYVLAGAGGNALAFGPGHERASAPLGREGVAVIGGHRDTHFAFLQRLQRNTLVQLQLPDGVRRNYRVEGMHIVDASRERMPLRAGQPSQLLLVTCYPFDALSAGGPLRYVVSARPLGGAPGKIAF